MITRKVITQKMINQAREVIIDGVVVKSNGRPMISEPPPGQEWPPVKKAVWDVVTGAELNDGYVNAWDLTNQIYRAVTEALFDPVGDIAEFHAKFGLEYRGAPRQLPAELSDFRQRFMEEELFEYKQHSAEATDELTRAPAYRDRANYTYHLEHMLDALVDEVYVVLGTAYLHGFDFREAWRRVHEANMKKVRATRENQSKRGSTFDVVKPEGWEPPSHIDLVEDHDMVGRE